MTAVVAACRGTSTTPARAKLALPAPTRFVSHHAPRVSTSPCPHDRVHAVHWVLTLRLPLSWSQSSNSCASCATYATSDVASAVASACHTRQDVLDLVSDISAGPCPVLKVTATSSTYLAGTYNIMPGFEVNGAPVYLREEYVGVVPAPFGIVLPLVTPGRVLFATCSSLYVVWCVRLAAPSTTSGSPAAATCSSKPSTPARTGVRWTTRANTWVMPAPTVCSPSGASAKTAPSAPRNATAPMVSTPTPAISAVPVLRHCTCHDRPQPKRVPRALQ